jgi:hypothetical protein
MDYIQNEDVVKVWVKKMAPPLVTLLGSEPEVRPAWVSSVDVTYVSILCISTDHLKTCHLSVPRMDGLCICVALATPTELQTMTLRSVPQSLPKSVQDQPG